MKNFIKNHGNTCNEDWERVQQFYQLSLQTDFFAFPKPRKRLGQEISYEQLNNCVPVADYITAENANPMFFKIGQALAFIHGSSKASNAHAPENDDLVGLHSDFSLCNLSWNPQTSQLVFLDPIKAKFYFYDDYCGDRYFDIAQLITSIFSPVYILKFMKTSPWLLAEVVEAFLDGYQAYLGRSLQKVKLIRFAKRIHHDYYRFWLKNTRKFRYIIGFPVILFCRTAMVGFLKCM